MDLTSAFTDFLATLPLTPDDRILESESKSESDFESDTCMDILESHQDQV